jgi:hypothetical protein
MSRLILAIDFDGTIVEHKFPRIGDAAPGAFEWLKRFQELDALLILYTMRSDGRKDGSTPLADAVAFCRENGIEFWQVNENKEQADWTCSPKIYAHHYIDDAAIGCPLVPHPAGGGMVVDWAVVGPLVESKILARKKAFEDRS